MSRHRWFHPTQRLWGLLLALVPATIALAADPSSGEIPPPMNIEQRRSRAEELRPRLVALANRFEARTFRAADGDTIPYRLFRPESDEPATEYPLVVYLHGGEGRGTDNLKQISGGNLFGARVWALPENQAQRPCFVLAPQLLEGPTDRGQMTVTAEKTADAAGSSVAGTWQQRIDGPMGRITMELTLQGEDDSLTGMLRMGQRRSMTVENASYEDGVLTYATSGGLSLEGRFTVRDRSFTGKLSTRGGRQRAEKLMALIRRVADESGVDRHRIYITGQSMGGGGTWGMLSCFPEAFAAAVPVCGNGNVAAAQRIVVVGTAIWAFHGSDDPRVPVESTRRMIAALLAAGGHPRYTEYLGVKHDSWVDTYPEPNLHVWLFLQSRRK